MVCFVTWRRRRAITHDKVWRWRKSMMQRVTRHAETIYNDDTGWHTWWRATMHDDDVGLQWRHAVTNDNGWRHWWLLSSAGSYYCEPRFTNLLIFLTFNINSEQYAKYSNFNNVPVTKHGAQTFGAQKPQINTQLCATYWLRGEAEYDG